MQAPRLPDGPHLQLSSVWRIPVVPMGEKVHSRHPTQKPLRLLRRAVLASTREGDLVFDPFSGSATTGVAAKELGPTAYALWRRGTGIWKDRPCGRAADGLAVPVEGVQISVLLRDDRGIRYVKRGCGTGHRHLWRRGDSRQDARKNHCGHNRGQRNHRDDTSHAPPPLGERDTAAPPRCR